MLTDYAAQVFSKRDLLEFAKKIRIFWAEGAHFQKELIDTIRIKAIKEGTYTLVPEFAFILRIVDDYQIPFTNPPCFGYCSDLDEACCYCGAYRECATKTIENLPDCFGEKFGESAVCLDCILKENCSIQMSYHQVDPNLYMIFCMDDEPAFSNMARLYAQCKYLTNRWPVKIRLFKHARLAFWKPYKLYSGWKSLRVHWNFIIYNLGERVESKEISCLILSTKREPIESGDYFRRLQ